MTLRILAFAGSLSSASWNRKLLDEALRFAPETFSVTSIHLKDYPLPLYDADLEKETGLPEPAIQLRALMKEHHGLLIASPEYNGGMTGVLKNTLDWMSRKHGTERGLDPFMYKPAAVISASPGPYGGARSLQATVFLLHRLGCVVLPDTLSVPNCETAFNGAGQLTGKNEKALRRVMETLARITLKLNG
ncbi:NADPH-dependent FMN reductase [Deinococcus cellulosilyticus]|uniref:Oxidoreductase n=1 Tax=Deinococcus cellulosilyticus (strain DSM 18568 / NBRC 106333 / KACC 11606 / 5516J-15) TaxID=1223518 RepID=A0A511N422_DEIC1|nr:NAD(P)H-dependent oxidoreductase [Deinococcus cellulosilyticus]GEM47613.1 oxidoreductase [Deinococcus cellulosilyticus NBRC 106333 = KACC 11606]